MHITSLMTSASLYYSHSKMPLTIAAEYGGLAIDTRRQKLYYADAGGKVGELSTDGTAHRVLISDVNSTPGAVVFEDENRCSSFSRYQFR